MISYTHQISLAIIFFIYQYPVAPALERGKGTQHGAAVHHLGDIGSIQKIRELEIQGKMFVQFLFA